MKESMTEAEVRDFLSTIPIPNTPHHLSDFFQTAHENTLIFEAPTAIAAAVDKARLFVEQKLGMKTILTTQRAPQKSTTIDLSHIKQIIGVASGKGGVGKSTTAVNIAVALQKQGLKVGLLDADIYGPSLPRLMGITQKPELSADKKIIPVHQHGIHCMSIGFMIEEERPVIWRGPMVQGALVQLLKDVDWPALDVLLIDMPPGTGDVQLTLAQQVAMTGAIIVSTPQDIALIDARKGIGMFLKVDVPVLGIVENMSQFVCPNCNHTSHIFSHGGAQKEAEKLGVPFLGELPLHIDIRIQSDSGTPIALGDSASAKAYQEIALKLTTNQC